MTIKNKYVVMLGALLAQVTIAGLYAFSILGTAVQSATGWGSNEVLFAYSLAQFIFAFSTIFSGRLVDKKGPRPALIVGGVLYGTGMVLSSFATSPLMLYMTYGVLVGAGVGFVYVCPLSTLTKWFPEKKGMVTGLAVGVFGGGSILAKMVITSMLENSDISATFIKLGILSMALILIGALLTNNPEGYSKAEVLKTKNDFDTKEMMTTSKFKKTWVMYWLAVIPGLLVLGAAQNIGMEVAGLDAATAANIVSILAVANATSRLVSGTLSDKFGVLNVLKVIFAITIGSLLGLGFLATNVTIFYLGVIGVAIGYGGFLALFPTLTNQEWGSYRYASNYGIVYQAYGIAALSGIFIKSISGSYTNTFIISAFAAAIGLVIAVTIKSSTKISK